MKITVKSSKAVKPAATANANAPRPDVVVVPLSVFDKVNIDMYVSGIYVFRPPTPPNAALEAGLARALAEYPEWAGRLGVDGRGNRAILLNGAGARLVEATADVALDAVLPLSPAPEVRSLHPSADGAEEVRLVQLTRFACGGLAIGSTAHHLISDGRAAYNFFLAWSQATRGVPVDPVPVHDRASFFKPRDPPRVEFDHRGVEFKKPEPPAAAAPHSEAGNNIDDEVLVHRAHCSREFIARLKSQASAPGGRPCSTLLCVVAHLWRCITAARGLHAAGAATTSVCIAVDGRARMIHPVPDGYTGNVVLWARPTAAARDLVARPLRHAVELINRELARVDGSYFGSFVDFSASGAVEAEGLVPAADAAEMVLSPNIEVNSWLQTPFYNLDFGGCRPCFFMPSYLPMEGLLILVPSYYRDGSIDAYVALFSRHMDTFKTLWTHGLSASWNRTRY
ncbi:hypothetical protein SETIT_2G010900v2 [Setaria italica]|uniref:Uncharacterized protein n=1 Tax=Setaria italica TaxID=4555 RepID=K4A363_SETIT|nr:agmatine coumaroyltransferase-2 [Setaria italica]RCV09235.1 hypothetical protein SETIT_2G010900v2 [Setaria italica]